MTLPDWHSWHDAYDDPDSPLARRLIAVQGRIRIALDAAPPGLIRVVSICAGQGRDLIGVLTNHPRRADVMARLVELDERNADLARQAAAAAGLHQIEVITGDAAQTDQYAGMAPAYLVLVCGVFGNISDADIERTIGYCTQLCERGGTVVWTRGRFEPDLVPQICDWFIERGFEELWVSEPDAGFGAGAHRFAASPAQVESARVESARVESAELESAQLEPGARMFTFIRWGGGARSDTGGNA